MKSILIGPRHYARYIFYALLLGILGWTTQHSHSTTAQIVSAPEFSISVTRMANDLVVNENGRGADNHITISRASNNTLQISDAIMGFENGLSRPGMVAHSESTEQETSLTEVNGALIINSMGGNDLLTIDLRNGSPIPSGGLIFNGGAQRPDGEGDVLEILGGKADMVIHRFVNANDGSIEVVGLAESAEPNPGSIAITYTGLEPVSDNVDATNREFSFTGGSETIVLNDGGDANDNTLFIDSTLGEAVSFTQPAGSLTIRTDQGTGLDEVQISGLDATFDANLTITADADDSALFTVSDTDAGSGDVLVNANTISVESNLASTGPITLMANGAITVSGGGITGGGNISLTADDNISVSGAVGVNSQSGSGAIRFDAGGAVILTEAGVQGASTIDLQSVGDMTLSQVWSYSTLANTIELTSTNGGLMDGSDSATDISAPAGTIVVRAAGGVGAVDGLGSDARLEIHGGSLDIEAGSEIDLLNSGGVAGLNLNAGSGDISLFAFGVITDTDADIDLAGNKATIIGLGALGSSGAPIETDLNLLEIDTSSDVGGHYLFETDVVTVTTIAANGGSTALYGGTFLVQNEILNPVQLLGGNLGGSGQVEGSVAADVDDSTLTPGFSPGILTVSGDLTLTASSTYVVELNGNVAGSGYDQTQVTGNARTVDLGGAALSITLGISYVHNALDTFVLIDNDLNDSTVTGTFAGLDEGAVIRLPGAALVVSYMGGDGNDVVLESIPLYTVDVVNGGTGGGAVAVEPTTIDGNYLPNAVVTLTATSLVTSTFDGWSGDAAGASNPLTITMNGDKSMTALFNTIVYTLTANSSGPGSGSIVLNPSGGVYDIGTVVEVEAIADENAFFSGWGGSLVGDTNPSTITMDSAQEITATFKIPTYTISIATSGDGVGAVVLDPPGNVYEVTTLVTATAMSAVGSRFGGWSGALTGMGNPDAFAVAADATVTATFDIIPTYTLTVEMQGDGAGSVTLDPPGGTYEEGTIITATATADAGSRFSGWGGALSGTVSPLTITIDANTAAVATFDLTPIYTLTIELQGDGAGSVTLDPPGGTYEEGTVITATATADAGSRFGGWSGALSGTVSPLTVTMDADTTAVATFDLTLSYLLTTELQGEGEGNVTLDPPGGTYVEGTVITATATADAGSRFGGWSGTLSDVANPVTVTMNADTTLIATFDKIPTYTLAIVTVGDGVGSVSVDPPGGIYEEGTAITLIALAESGSSFGGWSGDGGSNASMSFTLVMDTDKNINATFNVIPPDAVVLSVNTSGEGLGGIRFEPPGGVYSVGTEVTITATPADNSIFQEWSGSVSSAENPLVITMAEGIELTGIFRLRATEQTKILLPLIQP